MINQLFSIWFIGEGLGVLTVNGDESLGECYGRGVGVKGAGWGQGGGGGGGGRGGGWGR